MGPFVNTGTQRLYPGHFRARGARLKLCLLPESIESSGEVVTRWRDLSGYGGHTTFTGSPVLGTSGFAQHVVFDGANDRGDGALHMPDQPCTIFLLAQNAQASAADLPGGTGSAWIFDLTATGALGESGSYFQLHTNAVARQNQRDNGNAAYAPVSTDVQVVRVTFSRTGRALHVNGVWRVSNAISSPSTAAVTAYRLAQRCGDTFRWGGKLWAVLVYEGELPEKEAQRIEALLRTRAGIAAPFAWPLSTASATATPRFALPAVTYVPAGRPTQISKYAVWYRDGSDPALRATIEGIALEKAPPHCWQFTAPAPGDYLMTFTAGAHTASTILRAIPVLTAGASKRVLLPLGTSNIKRLAGGAFETLGDELGALLLQFVGTQGPEPGYSNKHEGIQSADADTFDMTGSPLWNGGGARNIAGYLAGLSVAPTHIFLQLYQNAVHDAVLANVNAAISHTTSKIESFVTDFRAAQPSVRIGVSTEWMLNPDPASGWIDEATRDDFHERMHRVAEEVLTVFGGREASGIDVVPTHLFTPFNAWADSIHLHSLGQVQPTQAILTWVSR